MKVFPSLRIEGGLLGADMIEKIFNREVNGLKPDDFGLDKRSRFLDEVSRVFSEARRFYEAFKLRFENLQSGELATEETRRYWVIPFLRLLGYQPTYNPRAYTIEGETFFISHRADPQADAPPIHIVGIGQELSKVSPTGRPRLSPHALVQEFLNKSEYLWGIVTNGRLLRLLRQTPYIRQQTYLEFDLQQIIEEQRFEDFFLFYLLLHRSRLPKGLTDASQCWLENYYQLSVEQGGRIRDKLRDNVEKCMKILGNAFLQHPKNEGLRQWVQKNPPEEFYRQLLKLIYRFLFLLVSEERGLISSSKIYLEHYGVSRFRKLVDNPFAYNDEEDLWHSLRVLRYLFISADLCTYLQIPPLNGKLFEELEFDKCVISNRELLSAFYYLLYYQESPSSLPRRVNYSALDTEELGSVYESLLDFYPFIRVTDSRVEFELSPGLERKSTGSYYTPSILVSELIKSALEPVLFERLSTARTKEEKENAILSLKICDPACGSGHFLLAASRRLGKELARIRSGEEEPPPEIVREAIRDVISHCIYGVDKNPLAIELCKVALWIEGHTIGKPLSFLEHRIKCGDSLVGVMDLDVLRKGIPDDAFLPVSDDDKNVADDAKSLNRRERYIKQLPFDVQTTLSTASNLLKELEAIADDTTQSIRKKEKLYEKIKESKERLQVVCDLWTYAFFQKLERGKEPITSRYLSQILEGQLIREDIKWQAIGFAQENRFFHWQLEFPEVFQKGGFDVLLFNPPWEVAELEEQEFFMLRDSKVANAVNKAERERMINELRREKPKLFEEYLAKRRYFDGFRKFLRTSGRFRLITRGRINLYSAFAELAIYLINSEGRAGMVIPTGIATDSNNKEFFTYILREKKLASLYDFENQGIFPAVTSTYKFSLLTLRGEGKEKEADFAFFCHHPSELKDDRRHIRLSLADLSIINPNTSTCPIFRSCTDAELAKMIYKSVPALKNRRRGEDPWKVRFLQFFNMASDSHLFRTREQLEEDGFKLKGNRFEKGEIVYLPLYEAKMFWLYDHRYGTYSIMDKKVKTTLPKPTPRQYADPSFLALPWYWVPEDEVERRLEKVGWRRKYLLSFRNITSRVAQRTTIFSILPKSGLGHTGPLILTFISPLLIPYLLANLSSIIFDWVARQKIGGLHMDFFHLEQLPAFPPSAYGKKEMIFIVPRVLELVYTAWDVKPFADDVWKSSDDELRRAIQMQFEENKRETGGNEWKLPEWLEMEEGVPFPPFRWDERRRAILQAELDAYFALLYGLNRKQLRYILDPADLTPKEVEDILSDYEEVEDVLDEEEYKKRCEQSDYPSESFRRLKEKEMEEFGEYRTRRLVLTAWEKLTRIGDY